VSGGEPVAVEGTELPLWGLEIDPERARDAFRAFAGKDNGQARAARRRAVPSLWRPCLGAQAGGGGLPAAAPAVVRRLGTAGRVLGPAGR